MPGLRIHFDLDFDAGFWPGPLADREAVAGELWLGPAGLIGRLETELGLSGPYQSLAERAAGLITAVQSKAGYWSESAEVDALATARYLLNERDQLVMAGWKGKGPTRRLTALAAVTAEAAPGMADRLAAIHEALDRRKTQLGAIELTGPLDELPALWRGVLAMLEAQGVVVAAAGAAGGAGAAAGADADGLLAAVRAKGDLQRAKSKPFEPKGDGTFQLIRPHGILEAANLVAAWLAAQRDDLSGTVIIGADSLLDTALRAHGLPTTGAATQHPGDCLSQVLPLVIDMAFGPSDPDQAAVLLSLPVGPVPPSIAGRLLDALGQWPAVGSPSWEEAVAEGLAGVDKARRAAVQARLDIILGSPVPRAKGVYPVAEAARRAETVAAWAKGHLLHAAEATRWHRVLAQTSRFLDLLVSTGKKALTRFELRQLLDEAAGSTGEVVPFIAEAGIAGVGLPGSIVGPVRRVIWWSFTRDSAELPRSLALDPDERRQLAAAKVEVAEPGLVAERRALRWRRPLAMAREAVLFVCPHTNPEGEESYPHPLWDELESAMPTETRRALRAKVEAAVPMGLAARKRKLAPIPAPVRELRAGGALSLGKQLSPSGLEKLIGCPLAWALHYLARLEGGRTPALNRGPLLYGNLAHHILETVLADARLTPDRAAKKAADLFDTEGPRLAGALFLPGAEAERLLIRHKISAAAQVLVDALRQGKMKVEAVEAVRERKTLGFLLKGRLDLIVSPGSRVIDFKWGRYTDRSRDLRCGAAFQLAAYSHMLSDKANGYPAVAYLILDSQRLVTNEPNAFPTAEVTGGQDTATAWAAAAAAIKARQAELADGLVLATANPGDDDEQPPDVGDIVEGQLVLPPPCNYCAFDTLCGQSFAEETP